MIKNIALGKYFAADSIIHKLDPRVKLLSSILFFILIFTTHSCLCLCLLLILLVITAILSHIPLHKYIQSLKIITILSFFTALINLFFELETRSINSNNFSITPEVYQGTLCIFMRFIVLVLTNSIVMFTTSTKSISDAIEYFITPLKYLGVNVQEIAITITISLRFMPILFEETEKIIRAQKARGTNFNSKNIIKKAKAFYPILAPLFIFSFKKANHLALAMESRSYDSSRKRTKYKNLKFEFCDGVATVCILIIFTGVIICNKILTF